MSWRPCRGAEFFASPDKWTSVWCHDEIVQAAEAIQQTVRVIGVFFIIQIEELVFIYNNFSKSVVIFNRSPSVCSIIIPFLSIRK